MDAAEARGVSSRDEVEVGQRIRRHDLEIDAVILHAAQPQVDVHERPARIAHAAQAVGGADLEIGRSIGVLAQPGAEVTRRAHRRGEHEVGMHVDDARVLQSGFQGSSSRPFGLLRVVMRLPPWIQWPLCDSGYLEI
jgi:hypothetical protein